MSHDRRDLDLRPPTMLDLVAEQLRLTDQMRRAERRDSRQEQSRTVSAKRKQRRAVKAARRAGRGKR